MLEVALKLLEEITARGFKAYIVGGFVRDYILGINSNDIDITTSATPKDIKEIFEDSCLPSEDYGSVTVIKKGIRFEITTFRKEIGYIDNRRPAEIKYIDDLYEDLLRRDFTINTICMDEKGEIVDLATKVVTKGIPAVEQYQLPKRDGGKGTKIDGIYYFIPDTLLSNVEDFHKLIYSELDYTPSQTVTEMSEKLEQYLN